MTYSVTEYTLLGFFYGISFIIILYDLVCFSILRKTQYLFYMMYMLCMVLYLLSSNEVYHLFVGTPGFGSNGWMQIVAITAAINCLLHFIDSYFNLNKVNPKARTALRWIMVLNIFTILPQIWYETDKLHLFIAIVILHIAFAVSFLQYRRSNSKSFWFLLSFAILDIGFIISWLAQISIIPSSVWTVYALYISVNLQFISISISMIQNVKQLGDEKTSALNELLAIADNNQMMRILALKKQMSPHFIFNSLNSILQRILSGNKEDASVYLVKLSKLIRKTLEQSDALYGTLHEELESLRIYLSLEAMRLGQSFQYSIEIDPEIHAETHFIPGFIIQPFVENSIWHGLSPKVEDKNLWIRVKIMDAYLVISIEDNGIGRAASAQQKKLHNSTSQGIKLIQERLELLNIKHQSDSGIEIIDLYGPENRATGTKVIIKTRFTNEQLVNGHHSR